MPKTYIERPLYVPRIAPFLGKDIIKVVTGQRRCGKSCLLLQIMDMARRMGARERDFVYVNKELHEFDGIRDSGDLLSYVLKRTRGRKKAFVFLDEVQEIEGFEKALRSLQARGGFDITCTGSNAELLSGELASALAARHVEVQVFALSYAEFLLFQGLQDGRDSFLKHLRYGGLPYLAHLDLVDDVAYEYLMAVCETILLKDVVARHGIRNVHFLERLVSFLADNIGGLVSAKRISDFLKSQRVRISPNVVLGYLARLCSAFLVNKVQRSDVAGRRIFEIGEKYYFGDLGLRNALVGYRPGDVGRMLENLVYTHLRIAGYRVTVGSLAGKEVDFVCDRGADRLYVQVAYLLQDEATRQREFGNLLAIKDNHPKVVVSLDEAGTGGYKGIEQVHVRDFLLRLAPPGAGRRGERP